MYTRWKQSAPRVRRFYILRRKNHIWVMLRQPLMIRTLEYALQLLIKSTKPQTLEPNHHTTQGSSFAAFPIFQNKERQTQSKEIDEAGCCWQGRQHCNLEQIGKQIVVQLCHLRDKIYCCLWGFPLSCVQSWLSPQSLCRLFVYFA